MLPGRSFIGFHPFFKLIICNKTASFNIGLSLGNSVEYMLRQRCLVIFYKKDFRTLEKSLQELFLLFGGVYYVGCRVSNSIKILQTQKAASRANCFFSYIVLQLSRAVYF